MKGTWTIGRIWGIQIEIHYTWLVIFGLIWLTLSQGVLAQRLPELPSRLHWLTGLFVTLFFFASVLLHELAHSVIANRHGQEIRRITLFLFGGVAHMTEESISADVELRVAAAGPVTSLSLGLVFYGLSWLLSDLQPLRAAQVGFRYLAFINVALAVFNLVPGFPLDGGRLLRAILWLRTGSIQQATRVASTVGQGFAYLLMGVGFLSLLIPGYLIGGLWWIAIGWFLNNAAQQSYHRLMIESAVRDVTVGDIMTREVAMIPVGLPLQDAVTDFFLRRYHRMFPVLDPQHNYVVGCIRMEDVSAVPREQWPYVAVGQVMHPLPPPEARALITDDAMSLLRKMAQNETGRLLVFDEQDRLVGVVSQRDIMRLVQIRGGLAQTGAETEATGPPEPPATTPIPVAEDARPQQP